MSIDLPSGVTLRPRGPWEGNATEDPKRAAFRSSWRTTVVDLGRELRSLDAENVVLLLDVGEADIRLDGNLRANVSGPRSEGVVLMFDTEQGPLRFPCDAFTSWRDNVRAITLALKALRQIERYGVVRSAEQYAGWKAIEATPPPAFISARDAEQYLAEVGGLATPLGYTRARLIRIAQRNTHPDNGGTAEAFTKVSAAIEYLSGL